MEHRKLDSLKANPLNPRGAVVHDVALRELAASIKSQGVLQPILVTPDGTIIAGHRRVEAAKIVNLSDVPVIIKNLTEAEQLQVMLIENIQRNDLTLLQTAKAYQALSQRGLSVDLIAKAIGVTKRSVSEHLMVFRLPSELHSYFDNGKLGLRTIPRLLELDAEQQLRLGHEAAQKGWGEIKVSIVINRIKKPKPQIDTVPAMLDRVFERIENGYYLTDEIMTCGECGRAVFNFTEEELQVYLQKLIDSGRIELRKQGGKKDNQRGMLPDLYVPADMPDGVIDFNDRNGLAAGNEYAR